MPGDLRKCQNQLFDENYGKCEWKIGKTFNETYNYGNYFAGEGVLILSRGSHWHNQNGIHCLEFLQSFWVKPKGLHKILFGFWLIGIHF